MGAASLPPTHTVIELTRHRAEFFIEAFRAARVLITNEGIVEVITDIEIDWSTNRFGTQDRYVVRQARLFLIDDLDHHLTRLPLMWEPA